MRFYDEMHENGAAKAVRPHYQRFDDWLVRQSDATMARQRGEADLVFRRVGITFAVYGTDSGTERLIPFDMIPRIIPRHEWTVLEEGLRQRVKALNMFIHDVYHDRNILRAN